MLSRFQKPLDIQRMKPQLFAAPQLSIYTLHTETDTSPSNSRARAPSPHLVPVRGHTLTHAYTYMWEHTQTTYTHTCTQVLIHIVLHSQAPPTCRQSPDLPDTGLTPWSLSFK